jgi:hypothetical protein
MGNCSSTSNCNPCGPDFSAINQLATKTASYARQANTYATNAENKWLEFNALYLGAFAVAPTVDNEGDPLQTGALYWNTVSNTIFVWNGTVWVENRNFNEFTNFPLVFPNTAPISAPNLRTGLEYQIEVVGNTNWTAIGAPSATVGVRFTKNAVAGTGTGTARVTRDLVTRFADVANVKDWGAVGDGVTDDSDAIQFAIFYKSNIYFPEGRYRITKQIRINRSAVSLFADNPGTAFITLDNPSVGIAFLFKSDIGACFKNSINNITIFNTASSTYQIGVKLERPESFSIINSEIGGFATCLDVRGGIGCYYNNIKLNSWTSTDTTPEAGTLQISDNTSAGGIYGYTHLFVNSNFNGSDYPIVFRGNDYASFSNCYISSGRSGGVLIQNDGSASFGNYSNNFDNCYFDRVFAPGPNAIAISIIDESPRTGNSVGTKITDCIFGGWDTHIKINKEFDPYTEITGCRFWDSTKSAIDINGNFTNLVITGNHFHNNTYNISGSSVIDVTDVHSITITGNTFSYLETKTFVGTRNVIKLAGTIDSASITGNTINTFAGANVTDLVNTATIVEFVVSGNSSDNANNTIVGSIIGNRENLSSVSLDWYQEGFFIPSLSFGGSSAGIIYNGSPSGHFTRIGNRVFIDIYIQLSNKGTATGDCLIQTMPFPKSGSNIPVLHANLGDFDAAVGVTNIEAKMPTSTTAQILKYASGSSIPLTDADFKNSSFFSISGVYFV